jgi:hypothetical protein
MGNLNQIPEIWVFHKANKKNSKPKIERFTDARIDDILDTGKRVPIIPYENEILEVGIGTNFEGIYKKKYKI